MEGFKRLNIDVDNLAFRNVKKRKKRDLNETVYTEINEKDVPAFTPEFLEENRLVESELRKLRKLNNDIDEHNSVLLSYVENLNLSCDRICDELKELMECKQLLSEQLSNLKSHQAKDKSGSPAKPVSASPEARSNNKSHCP